MPLALYTLVALAVLMAIGGAIGFRAGSKVSLMAGFGSAAAYLVCAWWAQSSPKAAIIAGIVICGVLSAMFALRFVKTKKFMPSGMLLVVTDMGLAVLVVSLFLL
ncbi:MAG: TMEM14 family protein [Acidobacteriota bacterium]|nr:TMEM14 family protein [Acidobacteriota bacterium]MDH3783788.1 TMEM14 family protein [Acidobacteriota bacterium]